MKKSIVTVILAVVFTIPAFSQKNAYVDTEYILSKIPAYENAQTKLNEYSKVWQKEVDINFNDESW